jgi:hypothetical protein
MEKSMAEGQVLRDAVGIGRVNDHRTAETAAALGVFGLARWRLPAWRRRTLPVPVILNRLDTDFFVLMPLGRRINLNSQLQKSAKYMRRTVPRQA